jgi:hypothetical protein
LVFGLPSLYPVSRRVHSGVFSQLALQIRTFAKVRQNRSMMGERTVAQEARFKSFSLKRHVPAVHPLRSIDGLVDLSSVRASATIL